MERLQFLKAFGLAIGGGVLAKHGLLAKTLSKTPLDGAAAPAVRYKAGTFGKILVSQDGGANWVLHRDFGSDYEIMSVREEKDGVYADVKFKWRYDFVLKLDAEGLHWLLL